MLKKMKDIKNIVFDLGKVILNIDFNATEREFRKFNVNNFDELYSRAKQISLFDRLEEGKITPDNFRKELRNLINLSLTDMQIDNAWNSMLLDFPENRIRFLESIKSKYRIFLLSNTNKIHFDVYNENFEKHYGYSFSTLFEKMYLSFEVGLRKPDKKIFQYLLGDSNIKPNETLFIDDTSEHIEAAKTLGFNTYLLKDKEEIDEILSAKMNW